MLVNGLSQCTNITRKNITISPQAVIAVVTVNDPVECLRHQQHYFPPAYLLYSESISHLLLLINSSINFLIYCVVVSVTCSSIVQILNNNNSSFLFEKSTNNLFFSGHTLPHLHKKKSYVRNKVRIYTFTLIFRTRKQKF